MLFMALWTSILNGRGEIRLARRKRVWCSWNKRWRCRRRMSRDASAGVLKDLKRFQKEKEDDLQRYMVSSSHSAHLQKLTICRSHMPDVTLIWRRRTSRRGRRHNPMPLIFILNEQLPTAFPYYERIGL